MSDIKDLLLWLDLETTGSDETKDSIIEVGCILTTYDLNAVGEFQAVVTPEPLGYGRMMLNPTVRAMHEANNLLWELSEGNGRRPHEVTNDLMRWLADSGASQGRTVLAGSGVGHFDRRFIARYMPQLDRFLRYWCIDIGVIRRAHEMWVGSVVSTENENKTHRAIDDVWCHLKEARIFRDLWRGVSVVDFAEVVAGQ